MQVSAPEIRQLDPYAFFAVLGKRVIHPGGRQSTEELFAAASLKPGQKLLDVGCGVATTAVEAAKRFGANVTAVDVAPLMLNRARANVRAAGLHEQVVVAHGDIMSLAFPDDSFDCVIAEAVTMFVDRPSAARELVRVCKPGGRVLATEFLWRKPPTTEARQAFLGEVCPGMQFDTLEDWVTLYKGAGLGSLDVKTGPFEMMTMRGFLVDEGLVNSLRVMGRAVSRPVNLRKISWLMPRMSRAVPYLGYVLVAGSKPGGAS